MPVLQLFKEDLAKRISEHLRNKGRNRAREHDESPMEYNDDEEDDITLSLLRKSL